MMLKIQHNRSSFIFVCWITSIFFYDLLIFNLDDPIGGSSELIDFYHDILAFDKFLYFALFRIIDSSQLTFSFHRFDFQQISIFIKKKIKKKSFFYLNNTFFQLHLIILRED